MIEESEDPIDLYHYANELVRKSLFAEAINYYDRAIALDPENLDCEVYVFAAWILATSPEKSLRNVLKAVVYARRACEISDYEPWPLSALAAAFAEAGNFPDAIDAQKRAIELYGDYSDLETAYLQKCQDRLRQYEASQTLDYDDEP